MKKISSNTAHFTVNLVENCRKHELRFAGLLLSQRAGELMEKFPRGII